MSEISETEIKAMTKEQNYIRGYKNGKSDVLDKIRTEIEQYEADCRLQGGTDECEKCNSNVFGSVYRIIDKYKAESEDKDVEISFSRMAFVSVSDSSSDIFHSRYEVLS